MNRFCLAEIQGDRATLPCIKDREKGRYAPFSNRDAAKNMIGRVNRDPDLYVQSLAWSEIKDGDVIREVGDE